MGPEASWTSNIFYGNQYDFNRINMYNYNDVAWRKQHDDVTWRKQDFDTPLQRPAVIGFPFSARLLASYEQVNMEE